MSPEDRARRVLLEAGDYYTLEDITQFVQSGRMQGFVENDSWVVTEILQFPRKSVIHIVFAVGCMQDMMKLSTKIEEFAVSVNVHTITAAGRAGWMRLADKYKWSTVGVDYVKEL